MTLSSEWDFGFKTDPGRLRKDEPNQDAVFVLPGKAGKAPLLVVADGMGGHYGGDTASRIVVETICQIYQQAVLPVDYGVLLKNCLVEAHNALRKYANKHIGFEDMGSTAVIAALDGDKLYVANVGDSRAYLLNSDKMKQVNFDHSLVADHVRAGLLTSLEALQHSKRNRLTQSITVKRSELQPFVTQVSLNPHDTVLLCTDGLWGVVADSVVHAVAIELIPSQAVEKLVSLAYIRQAPDNISVVIARRKTAKTKSMLDNDEEDSTDPGL